MGKCVQVTSITAEVFAVFFAILSLVTTDWISMCASVNEYHASVTPTHATSSNLTYDVCYHFGLLKQGFSGSVSSYKPAFYSDAISISTTVFIILSLVFLLPSVLCSIRSMLHYRANNERMVSWQKYALGLLAVAGVAVVIGSLTFSLGYNQIAENQKHLFNHFGNMTNSTMSNDSDYCKLKTGYSSTDNLVKSSDIDHSKVPLSLSNAVISRHKRSDYHIATETLPANYAEEGPPGKASKHNPGNDRISSLTEVVRQLLGGSRRSRQHGLDDDTSKPYLNLKEQNDITEDVLNGFNDQYFGSKPGQLRLKRSLSWSIDTCTVTQPKAVLFYSYYFSWVALLAIVVSIVTGIVILQQMKKGILGFSGL
ncbi:uncharacterized protein LOC143449545 [Clavelina lepadiformis]|uniref:uncharacterized protein LOC143449545 n=1 Tax=Clavelina lepadiformis TaxID=159417 RepID=UPI004041AE08